MAELLKAPADGRTLLYGSSALYSIIPHIYGAAAGFDPFKDVTPLSRISSVPVGIAAGLHIKSNNIAEFRAWAKANPAGVSYASPGAGTSSHFAGLMLSKALGIPMAHVPYSGTAPALADLIGGHIPLVFSAVADFTELARDGKLSLLATTGSKRSPAASETRTLKEQGVDISFEIGFDAYAKAGVPAAALQRLGAALVAAGRDPEVRAKLVQIGNEPFGGTAEELLAAQQAEFRLWEAPVKESGYKGE
jgi:tripartite-type tricarboxylate transporter receptor subunit TctC